MSSLKQIPAKTKISHDNSIESKENHNNEKFLWVELNDFVNMLKRQFFQRDILDLWTIRNSKVSTDNTLENEFTYEIIYPHAQRGYELGVNYINRLLGKSAILLPLDMEIVQDLTKFYNEIFWNRLKDVIDRNYLNFNVTDNRTDELSNNFVITSLATAICWKPLSLATEVKSRAMIKPEDLMPQPFGFVFHAGIKQIEKQLMRNNPGLFNIGKIEQPSFAILVWKWVTSHDAKVCSICQDLSDQEWAYDETFLPENPDSSHPSCRCRLMLGKSDRPIL
jgi:hypothetical protein